MGLLEQEINEQEENLSYDDDQESSEKPPEISLEIVSTEDNLTIY